MKVWVVSKGYYEDWGIIGVYSSREEAEHYIVPVPEDSNGGDYQYYCDEFELRLSEV